MYVLVCLMGLSGWDTRFGLHGELGTGFVMPAAGKPASQRPNLVTPALDHTAPKSFSPLYKSLITAELVHKRHRLLPSNHSSSVLFFLCEVVRCGENSLKQRPGIGAKLQKSTGRHCLDSLDHRVGYGRCEQYCDPHRNRLRVDYEEDESKEE